MARFRSLYLSLRPDDCEKTLDSLESGRGMTTLRDFFLRIRSPRLILSTSMMEKISSFASNISALSLWNVDNNLSSLTFPRLLQFSLVTKVGFRGLRVSDMIGFLRGCPTLKVLNLHRARYSHMDVSTDTERVALRHLKSARLGGRPSLPSTDSLPYIEVDLLPYLCLLKAGECNIYINPINATVPHDTNYLLTLIHAWGIISGSEDGSGGGARFSYVNFSIKEGPSALEIVGLDDLRVKFLGPEGIPASSQSVSMPDWEAVTMDEVPGAGGAGGGEVQTQLSRLDCFLAPLRWNPSPLAALDTLLLSGFGYTSNKGKYLQYLRECFSGLGQIRRLQVKEMNLWMIGHLLRPFEAGSGEVVMVFPLLEFLSFDKCTPAEPPLPALVEVMKRRVALGSVLETLLADGEEVDLSGLSDVQEERSYACIDLKVAIQTV